MEKPRNKRCVWVTGEPDNLNRAILKEQFQKFSKVTKIYIDLDNKYAKVYLENPQFINKASEALTGFRGWQCSYSEDIFPGNSGSSNSNSNFNRDTRAPSDTTSLPGSLKEENMEPNFFDLEEYVDINGRPVEVVPADNGQLFVSLDDMRVAGFNVYPKAAYKNSIILKGEDLKAFEAYLMHQAENYILGHKKPFKEDEMISVLKRVRTRWVGDHESGDPGRLISDTSKKNFSITTPNELSTGSGRGRPPKQLAENFQPSFSFKNAKPQDRGSHRQGGSHSVRNGHGGDNRASQTSTRSGNRGQDNVLWDKQDQPQPRKPRTDTRKPQEPTKQEPEEKWGDESIEPPKVTKSDVKKPPPNVNRIQLPIGGNHKVKVSHIYSTKSNIFHGHPLEAMDQVEAILLHVNTVDNALPEIAEPKRDMLGCALFEDIWYRAIVITSHPDRTYVELIDYGNRENISTPVRELSEEMRGIPGQAVRCALNNNEQANVTLDQVVEVFIKKHVLDPEYDDQTHVVDIKQILEAEKEAVSPESRSASDMESVLSVKVEKEECFMEIPPTSAKLEAGATVQIVNYIGTDLILRNKDTALVCKEVYAHIASMPKKAISNPVLGQIVLCSKDGDDGLHRAVIKKVTDKTADLEYLEYGGDVTLSLKSLKNIDERLATLPRAILEHPYPVLKGLNVDAENFLADLMVEKKKVKAVNQGGSVDFQLADGTLLSDKIKSLVNPPPAATSTPQKAKPVTPPVVPKPEPTPKETPKPASEPPKPASSETPKEKQPSATSTDEPVTFDSMPYVEPALGKGPFTCYSCTGESLTLVSLSDENIVHLSELLDIKEPEDDAPLDPEPYQMCLAKFEDLWYRALITEVKNDKLEVLFVDFGNAELVPLRDVRMLPKSLAAIPIIGINASFQGIPDKPAVYERLKELCANDEEVEADILKYVADEMKYLIEIPSVYEQLRKEGLM